MYRSAAIILGALIAGAALAHEHATGVIAERMDAMKNMGREMEAIGKMLFGNARFDFATVVQHAEVLHEICHRTEGLFPPGSIDHHSHARPAIWEEPEAFRKEILLLHNATESLMAIAALGDMAKITTSFEQVRNACDSCHETFRMPEH